MCWWFYNVAHLSSPLCHLNISFHAAIVLSVYLLMCSSLLICSFQLKTSLLGKIQTKINWLVIHCLELVIFYNCILRNTNKEHLSDWALGLLWIMNRSLENISSSEAIFVLCHSLSARRIYFFPLTNGGFFQSSPVGSLKVNPQSKSRQKPCRSCKCSKAESDSFPKINDSCLVQWFLCSTPHGWASASIL